MKKVVWTYEYFKELCDRLAQTIADNAEATPHLIAVARGGTTAAHRIAYRLGLPLNFYNPSLKQLHTPIPPGCHIFFIEDLVAKGRTYENVQHFMRNYIHVWDFVPVLVDAAYHHQNPGHFHIKGVVEKDWVVFPYEDEERVKVGDWGLFRDGTAESAKPLEERNK